MLLLSESTESASIWFLLLSHHSKKNLSRTIKVHLMGRALHLCARCTGIVIGILMGVFYANWLMMVFISYPVVIALFPVPATADWLIQVHGLRESTNWRRVLTGAMLGQVYLVGLLAITSRHFPLLTYLGIVWLAYIVFMYVLFRRTNALSVYLRKSW